MTIFTDLYFWLRVLIEISVVLVGGLLAYIATWQLRQDQSIREIREDLIKLKEVIQDHDRIITRNIPDAWTSADKARDALTESLTRLCLHVLGSAPKVPPKVVPQGPHKKKHKPVA